MMIKTISWIGTIASILGSFLMAFGFMLIGYICFTLGSVSWLIVGFVNKDKALITLNGAFFTANLIGLYNAIF